MKITRSFVFITLICVMILAGCSSGQEASRTATTDDHSTTAPTTETPSTTAPTQAPISEDHSTTAPTAPTEPSSTAPSTEEPSTEIFLENSSEDISEIIEELIKGEPEFFLNEALPVYKLFDKKFKTERGYVYTIYAYPKLGKQPAGLCFLPEGGELSFAQLEIVPFYAEGEEMVFKLLTTGSLAKIEFVDGVVDVRRK